MLEAIRAKDVELAHAHMRQFKDDFMQFLRENYTTHVFLGSQVAAE